MTNFGAGLLAMSAPNVKFTNDQPVTAQIPTAQAHSFFYKYSLYLLYKVIAAL